MYIGILVARTIDDKKNLTISRKYRMSDSIYDLISTVLLIIKDSIMHNSIFIGMPSEIYYKQWLELPEEILTMDDFHMIAEVENKRITKDIDGKILHCLLIPEVYKLRLSNCMPSIEDIDLAIQICQGSVPYDELIILEVPDMLSDQIISAMKEK